MKNILAVFTKIHSIELLKADKALLDVEIAVIDVQNTVPGQVVELSMNGKTHLLHTLDNGRLRTEVIFPFRGDARQQLYTKISGAPTNNSIIDIIPPGYESQIEDTTRVALEKKYRQKIDALKSFLTHEGIDTTRKTLPLEEVLRGKRPIQRGESLVIERGFYDVTADIIVERGGKLVIEAGTTLEFSETAGILCQGVLEAIGGPDARITFTSIRSHWRNIMLYGRHTTDSRLRYCTIEHGTGRALVQDKTREIYMPDTMKNNFGECNGGALQLLYTENAELFLENLLIRDNIAKLGKGGGLFIMDSAPIIRDSEISRNKSSSYGGGLYVRGAASKNAKFNSLKIRENVSSSDGGGLFLEGVAPISQNLEILANAACFGGGVYHNDIYPDSLLLTNCRISDNESIDAPEENQDICGEWPKY